MLDSLALLTGQDHLSARRLCEAVVDDAEQARRRLGPATRAATLALALAWAGRAQREDELEAAAVVYEVALATLPARALSARHQLAAAQTLLIAGRPESLRGALPRLAALDQIAAWSLRVDLENPFAAGVDHPHGDWEDLLSQPFRDAGAEPLSVCAPDTGDAFDGLGTSPAAAVAGDALVSVVVPAYRPDVGLLTSVRSLLAQTWQDLEVIVVDDGSGDGYDDVLDGVAALDPRVVVIRLRANGGTYRAFNAGIRAARGELIAFQGADDWSHPRRLERQIARLRAAAAPASQSDAVRARPDLTLQWFGYPSIRRNASSLLVRADVVERLGPFLEVRKAADSEYLLRIARFSGEIAQLDQPQAMVRLGAGSLSRADFGFAWHSPQRIDFRQTFRAWVSTLDLERPPLPVAAEPAFDVPRAYLPDPTTAPAHLPHEVWLGDLSEDPTVPARSAATAMLWETWAAEGPVALWHVQSPSRPTLRRLPMHPRWYERVVASPDLRTLTRLEPVAVDTVHVLDPRLLVVVDGQSCAVRARAVTLLVDPATLELDDPDGLFLDVLVVADACMAWWGVGPTWRIAPWCSPAEADRIRTALPALVHGDRSEADAVPSLPA